MVKTFNSVSYAAQDYKQNAILDPGVSRRCDLLLEKRQEKLKIKQRIVALIEQNKKLQKRTPENKKVIKEKLEANLGRLERELDLTKTQIQYQEENIVRKGCPGIAL